MGLHPQFPTSPFDIIPPNQRWFPSNDNLQELSEDKLRPPLVQKLRQAVYNWRKKGYPKASPTSQALLNWWFKEKHFVQSKVGRKEFCYYFAQREAVETVIYLHDVENIQSHHELLKFDSSGAVSLNMFQEDWRRYVIKMATGSGKTKVMSLLIAWSYFHKMYESQSDLARNFLLIAPNIIVLDRLRSDFEGLKIFLQDPVIPKNGHEGKDWQNDFQLDLSIQDEVSHTQGQRNLFLTNIHRVYADKEQEVKDNEFLGSRPVTQTLDSVTDLKEIVKDVDELMVINDEAHHIHDDKLAWFGAIEDLHDQFQQKDKKNIFAN